MIWDGIERLQEHGLVEASSHMAGFA